jgi:hypothetical protein
MKTSFKFFILLIFINFWSCKKQLDYKYSDKEDFLKCDGINNQIYKEALFSFENDLKNYHGNPNSDITSSYYSFLFRVLNGTIKPESFVSPHTLLVFEALKEDKELWNLESKRSKLNYSSAIIKCISKNIQDKDTKTTFNALLSVNSMDPKTFGISLTPKYKELVSDKHLALYVALDFIYAKLFDIDETKVMEKENVDANLY